MRLAATLSFLFKHNDLHRAMRHATRCNFKHLEMLFPYKLEPCPNKLKATCQALDANFVLFNANPGNWDQGQRGIAAIPKFSSTFKQTIVKDLEYANTIHCPFLHVLAGNKNHGADQRVYVENLNFAAKLAEQYNVTILVEALNADDFPDYLMPTVADAARIVESVNRANCRLQLDLYHSRKSLSPDVSAEDELYKYLPITAHLQIANPRDRGEPSEECVKLLQLAHRNGFEGHVGCEYNPTRGISERESLKWAEPYGISGSSTKFIV